MGEENKANKYYRIVIRINKKKRGKTKMAKIIKIKMPVLANISTYMGAM